MKKANFRREIIIQQRMLDDVEHVSDSGRNKEIVQKYVDGSSYNELATEYGLTSNRIQGIIVQYISHVGEYRNKIAKDAEH